MNVEGDGQDVWPWIAPDIRELYYRELIARFAHHHASNWNLGEENDIWDEVEDPTQERIKSYIEFIHDLDPYDHPVVIHTYPQQHEEVYRPLLGDASELDGLSIQTAFDNVHAATLKWVNESSATSKIWVVSNDEQNSHLIGVKPDGPDSNQDDNDNIGAAKPATFCCLAIACAVPGGDRSSLP